MPKFHDQLKQIWMLYEVGSHTTKKVGLLNNLSKTLWGPVDNFLGPHFFEDFIQ